MLPMTSEGEFSESDWNAADLGQVNESEASKALDANPRPQSYASTPSKPMAGSFNANVSSRSANDTSFSGRSTMSTTGRRALSNSIRHHAEILQHKAVDNMAIDDPTEAPPRPQQHLQRSRSDTLDEEAGIGSDWNFFTPPTIPPDWGHQYIRSVPALSRKRVIFFTVLAFLISISCAALFSGLNKAGFRVEPSSINVKNTLGTAIQSVSAAVSGISQTSMQLQDANIILPSYIENNLGGLAVSGMIPFYVVIPQTGGLALQRLTRKCLDLVEASGMGSQDLADTSLTVKLIPDGGKYLNVDMITESGLERASTFHIASSGLVDIVYSPLFHLVTEKTFETNHTGHMLTILRHPVDRAIAMYRTNPNLAGMDMEQYIQSGHLENNYVTRILVNKFQGDLVKEDLEMALDILRRKCLIGLSERLPESMERFRRYFGWPDYNAAQAGCLESAIETHDEILNQTMAAEGESLWNAILLQNAFDVQVYDYAKVLYDEQSPQ